MCAVYQSMKCCRVFRNGFPRQSTTYRGFPLYSVFHDGKHAIPRWGLKKTRLRCVVENRGKCKKHAVPSVDINLVHTARFWKNLHQVCSRSKDWKAK